MAGGGGSESKVGGVENILRFKEATSGHRKNFFPKNIVSIIRHVCFYLKEWASKIFRAMSRRPRNFLCVPSGTRKYFLQKSFYSDPPPPVINDDRSLSKSLEIQTETLDNPSNMTMAD